MSLTAEQLGKPLRVARRIQETPDAVSLVLDIPASLKAQFNYQAGQFVTFFLNLNGEVVHRSYSLSSSPLSEGDFKVTIKKVAGGRGSTFLCDQVKEGDILYTAPPAGTFFKMPTESKGTHYCLIAAGSGITPIFSIMKSVLTASPLNHVTLLYCNRNEQAIIFRREIEDWAKRFPSRLDVVLGLDNPPTGWTGLSGRITKEFLTEYVEMPSSGQVNEYYLCGPSEFMAFARGILVDAGVNPEKIHQEDFVIPPAKSTTSDLNDAWTFIGDNHIPAETPEKIIATINGQTIEIPAKVGQSVLETLLEAKAQPPYSCMDGVCMACLAKIESGRVYQENPGILSDENIAKKEILTCQAKPLSRVLKLSYDIL